MDMDDPDADEPSIQAQAMHPTRPGDWTCPECGNINFANREVCNTRKCRAPRPDLEGQAHVIWAQEKAYGAMRAGPSPGMARVNPYAAADAAGDKWKCPGCGNENFAFRQVCNTRKCQMPKPEGNWTCLHCGNSNYPNRMVCNTRKCQAPKPGSQQQVLGMGPSGAFGAVPVPQGMLGQDVRDMMGSVKRGMLGGADESFQRGKMAGMMEALSAMGVLSGKGKGKNIGGGDSGTLNTGDQNWVCTNCSNINYGNRIKCNMAKCQRLRPGFNEGDWICAGCKNHNYASREFCNTKKCQMPRPDNAGV